MTKLQPMYDPKLRESYVNHRNSARLVADVVDDRTSKIGRSKVFEHDRRQSHQAYDQVTTNIRSKILTIVLKSQKQHTTCLTGRGRSYLSSKIGLSKAFEHVQNFSPAILTRK